MNRAQSLSGKARCVCLKVKPKRIRQGVHACVCAPMRKGVYGSV